MKKFIIGIIGLIFLGLIGYQIYKTRHQKTIETAITRIPVKVSQVKYREMTWRLNLTGDILPNREVDVYPKIGGEILEKLYVDKGDRVSQGQVIGVIERETIMAKLNQAKAALDSAQAKLSQIEANLESIKRDYERVKKLYTQKVVSKQKLDHITAQYESMLAGKELAMAQINQAKSALRVIQILYNNHTITAPISGLITARYLDVGAMVSTKSPIVRITDDSLLKVSVAIDEKNLPVVRIGQTVYVHVDAYPQKVFKGQIKVINPRVDPTTRSFIVEIYISNSEYLLKPGMFAHVELILGKKKVLAIPRDALEKLPATGSYYVFVIEENKARPKNVHIGLSEGNFVEITAGLRPSEIVVIKGQNRLKEGLPVEIVGKL